MKSKQASPRPPALPTRQQVPPIKTFKDIGRNLDDPHPSPFARENGNGTFVMNPTHTNHSQRHTTGQQAGGVSAGGGGGDDPWRPPSIFSTDSSLPKDKAKPRHNAPHSDELVTVVCVPCVKIWTGKFGDHCSSCSKLATIIAGAGAPDGGPPPKRDDDFSTPRKPRSSDDRTGEHRRKAPHGSPGGDDSDDDSDERRADKRRGKRPDKRKSKKKKRKGDDPSDDPDSSSEDPDDDESDSCVTEIKIKGVDGDGPLRIDQSFQPTPRSLIGNSMSFRC